ncbi:MAG: clostripain-related cysteine peptidase [Firmicutes bacterium]|nr:clostripain-related cysteine peptidase [Bacillota bacterium]
MISSCTDSFEKNQKAEWSILIYSSATSDIDGYSQQAIKELEKTGSSEKINIALQLGRAGTADNAFQSGVKRFYITKNQDSGREMSSKPVEDLKDVNMADSRTLSDFVEWGMKKYPAKHTMLVIGGHAGGFLGAVTNSRKTELMPVPDIKNALDEASSRTGIKPDIITFNSCFMGQLEPLHHLKDNSQFLVASEKPEYRQGLPLGKAISAMEDKIHNNEDVSPAETAKIIVESASSVPQRIPAIAAFQSEKLEKTASLLDKLSFELLNSSLSRNELKEIVENSAKPYLSQRKDPVFSDYTDLKSFCTNIIKNDRLKGSSVAKAATALAESLQSSMISGFFAESDKLPPEELSAGGNMSEKPGGMSVYFPLHAQEELHGEILDKIQSKYDKLDISRYKNWCELRKL